MKRRGAGCIEIEADLVAAAIGEADAVAEGRVAQHVVKCESCRNEHSSYQAIDRELGVMREAPVDPQGVAQSRERLEAAARRHPEPDRGLPGLRFPAGADPPGALGAGRGPPGIPSRSA